MGFVNSKKIFLKFSSGTRPGSRTTRLYEGASAEHWSDRWICLSPETSSSSVSQAGPALSPKSWGHWCALLILALWEITLSATLASLSAHPALASLNTLLFASHLFQSFGFYISFFSPLPILGVEFRGFYRPGSSAVDPCLQSLPPSSLPCL